MKLGAGMDVWRNEYIPKVWRKGSVELNIYRVPM